MFRVSVLRFPLIRCALKVPRVSSTLSLQKALTTVLCVGSFHYSSISVLFHFHYAYMSSILYVYLWLQTLQSSVLITIENSIIKPDYLSLFSRRLITQVVTCLYQLHLEATFYCNGKCIQKNTPLLMWLLF